MKWPLLLGIKAILYNPQKVFILSLAFVLTTLLLNGSFYYRWSMNRDKVRLSEQLRTVQSQIRKLDLQIREANDPSFLQRQALDRYDFVGEKDLIFVFSDD